MLRRDDRVLPVAVAATLATLVVVFYYPVGSVLVGAVHDAGQFTLAPLLAVLSDPFYHDLFAFTAYQALLSTLASVAFGLPGAYLLARFEFPGRRFLRSVTILPFVLPSIMVAVGFLAMFGRTGLLNDVLGVVGLGPVELTFTLEIIVLAHAFYNAPLVTRLVTAAWESVDPARVETARTLGASPLRAFRDVTLPQLLPALLTASVLTFVFTFMSFPIVLALGGLELATVEVWLFARVQSLDLTEAAALGAIETLLSLGLIYLYLRFEATQLSGRGETRGRSRTPLVAGWRSLVDPKRLALFAYAAVALVLFVGPLLSLVVESVTTADGTLTLRYYEFLLAQQASAAVGTVKPLPAIQNSLLFAVGTLLLAVPMGVLVAIVESKRFVGNRLLTAVLMAPLAVSGIVLGLGLLQGLVFGTELLGHRITVTGPVAIVAAHAVAAYPFVARTVAPLLKRVDQHLLDSARVLGATRSRVRRDIEIPLIVPGIVAGAALAFAISIGEFDSTVILAEGSGSYTMPVAVERYLGNRTLGPATAMGTVLLIVTAGSFVVIDRVGGWWEP